MAERMQYRRFGSFGVRAGPQSTEAIKVGPMTTANFNYASVSHSNLNGYGPQAGEKTLRFTNISVVDGISIDLVIRVDNASTYEPKKARQNGLIPPFGSIQVKCGTIGRFFFEFFDHDSGLPVEIERFEFSFVDIDGDESGTFELVGLAGTSSYYVSDSTVLQTIEVEKGVLWRSTTIGTFSDNPTSLDSMTQDQKDKTVTAVFENTAAIHALIHVSNSDSAVCEAAMGRLIMFAFHTAVAENSAARTNPKVVTTTTTPPPCLNITFENAYIVRSNLGGFGPDSDGVRGLVFGGVASIDGDEVLLHVTAGDNYVPGNSTHNGFSKFHKFGRVNGKCGTSVDLRFQLVRKSDGAPYVAERLCIEFTGFDSGFDKGGCAETIAVGGYDSFYLSNDTVLTNTTIVEGLTTLTSFTGSVVHDTRLGLADRSVAFEFASASEFSARFAWEVGGNFGRNIYFSGARAF